MSPSSGGFEREPRRAHSQPHTFGNRTSSLVPLPYGRQSIDDEDVAEVVEALRSDYLTTGSRVAAFERALASATTAKFAASLSSGTAALHAAYAALGVTRGDEVVVPPLTFAATANAALYLGAHPVFADVDLQTGLLDPAAAAESMTPRTKAIVAVDYAGLPADYDAIRASTASREVEIVADAAHSLGASDNSRPVGTLADITAFSFHPVKIITTGEGGAVTTQRSALHQRVLDFRNHGIVRDRGRFETNDGPWHQEMQSLGYNFRLTDIQCALGVSQLRKLAKFLDRRREIARRYDNAFKGIDGLALPGTRPNVDSSWHLYVLRVDDDGLARREFFGRLRRAGLLVQVHYLPVYLHPYYRELGYRPGQCPNAEQFYRRSVSIPIYPGMNDVDVDRVIEAISVTAHDILG